MFVSIKEIDKNLYLSPMALSGDSRPADIYSFFPQDYPALTDELNAYSKTLGAKDDHRLTKNYVDIDFNEYSLVSMWKRDNVVVGFATGWNRKFYPDASIRILNRFYHDKIDSRVKFTREVLRPSTFHCIQHQLFLAQKLNFEYAFISREPRTNVFFKKFVNSLNNKSTHEWKFGHGPYLVAPDPVNHECWQSIAATKLKSTDFNFWNYWRIQNDV